MASSSLILVVLVSVLVWTSSANTFVRRNSVPSRLNAVSQSMPTMSNNVVGKTDAEVVILLPDMKPEAREEIEVEEFNYYSELSNEVEERQTVTTGEEITTGITTGVTTGITSGITTGVTTGITTGITTGEMPPEPAGYPCAYFWELFDNPQIYERIYFSIYDCNSTDVAENTAYNRSFCRRLFDTTIVNFDEATQKICLNKVLSCNKFSQRKFQYNCVRFYDIKVQVSAGCPEAPEAAPIIVPLNPGSWADYSNCVGPETNNRWNMRGVKTVGDACTTLKQPANFCFQPEKVINRPPPRPVRP